MPVLATGECWVGFELDEGAADPADSGSPPSTGILSLRPFTFTRMDPNPPLPEITTDWSHTVVLEDASTFGGDRSLRLALADGGGNPCAVEFTCGAGSRDPWEIRFYLRAEVILGGNFTIIFYAPGEAELHGTLFVDADGSTSLEDAAFTVVDSTNVGMGDAPIFEDGHTYEVQILITCQEDSFPDEDPPPGRCRVFVRDLASGLPAVEVVSGYGQFLGNVAGDGLGAVYMVLEPDTDFDAEIYLDDFMAFPADTLTSAEKFILAIRPNGDSEVDSTASTGTDRWTMVDEVAPSDSDRVSFANNTDLDLYTLTALQRVGTIWGVSVLARTRSSSVATDWEARVALQHGVTTAYGDTYAVEPSGEEYRTLGSGFLQQPDGSAWTLAAARAMVAGLDVVTESASGGTLDMSWLGVEVLVDAPDLTAPSGVYVITEGSRTIRRGLC